VTIHYSYSWPISQEDPLEVYYEDNKTSFLLYPGFIKESIDVHCRKLSVNSFWLSVYDWRLSHGSLLIAQNKECEYLIRYDMGTLWERHFREDHM
jgi:hypothetical protein